MVPARLRHARTSKYVDAGPAGRRGRLLPKGRRGFSGEVRLSQPWVRECRGTGTANVRLLLKGLASHALWPVGVMFFGGIALAEAVFAAPQAFVDQAFGLMYAWGVAGAFTTGRWGLDIRLVADPELRRLMLASMAVAGLLLVLLAHQAALFLTRP